MSDLIAAHYPNLATACDVMQTLERLEADQVVELDDAVLVERRCNGEVKLHHSRCPTATGGAGGALWGALIGLIFLQPSLGMAGDAMNEIGVDRDLMRQLGDQLPDGAGVFVLARRPDLGEARALARSLWRPHPPYLAERPCPSARPGRDRASRHRGLNSGHRRTQRSTAMATANQPQSPQPASLLAPLAHAPAGAACAAGLAAPGLLLRRVLVLFWAEYFSIIALTNLVDVLDAVGAIHWMFLNSGNLGYLRSVVKIYGVGSSAATGLLVGGVVIEAATAAMFWRALIARRAARARLTLQALTCAAAAWIAFIFMTEFFVGYPSESVFCELLLLTVATAICVTVVPEG